MQRSGFSFAVFIAVMSSIVGLFHYYLYSRLIRAPEIGLGFQRTGAYVFIGLALLTPPWNDGPESGRPRPLSTVIAWVVYCWMGLAVILFFSLVASEAIRGAIRAYSAAMSQPFDSERRALISAHHRMSVVSVVALGAAGAGTISALGKVGVKKVKVALAKFPETMSGFRIVQISDLHIGPTIGREWLEEIVAQVNALDPDIVAITGDLVWTAQWKRYAIKRLPLADLKAKHGVFFVTGNHEYYSGADEWIAEARAPPACAFSGTSGYPSAMPPKSFDLAGADRRFGREKAAIHGPRIFGRALAGRDPSRECISSLINRSKSKRPREAAWAFN